MSDSLNLSTTPLFIAGGTEYEADIVNGGPGTIYYGTTNAVTSTTYDGTIASGNRLHVTSPKWIVSTTNTKVFIDRYATYTEDVDYDVKVVGETLNLSNDGTTDNAATLNAAQDNIESQGGGRILIGRSGRGTFAIDSLVTFGDKVSIIGQGKRETEFKCTDAAAGFWFVGSSDDGYGGSTNRGGESGGFEIQGNNTATTPLTIRSTNRNFRDIRVSTPANNGKAIYINSAQNCNFFGIEAEDGSHTASRSVSGIVLDGCARGCNFFGGSINEFTNGHILIDASYDADDSLGADYSTDIQFHGMLIERCDRMDRPIVWIKSGADIHFWGGAIVHGGDTTPSGDYYIVDLDNSAARSYTSIGGSGAPTRSITFDAVNFYGAMNGSTRHATVFRTASELNNWTKALDILPTCTYTNCKYGVRIDAGTICVNAPNMDARVGGGLSAGSYHPSGAGKPNTRIASTATTLPTRPVYDYYEWSGNTNIDSMTVTYPGHVTTHLFSGTPTISSSAGNIKLSGLSDMTVSADDLICLVCDGTNWHETSRVVK